MRVLAIGTHPDDVELGCGGTVARYLAAGDDVHVLIVTRTANPDPQREQQVARAAAVLGGPTVHWLNYLTTSLDYVPADSLVRAMGRVVRGVEPQVLMIPHAADVHTDHVAVRVAAINLGKWFRYPGIMRVLSYEVLSETDQSVDVGFVPNYFVDVTATIGVKLEAIMCYRSEVGEYPFPRSADAVRALATVRGAASGFVAAEAFVLLRERVSQ